MKIRRLSPLKRIWHDGGSGARLDGSFWTLAEENYGWRLLGDISCRGHSKCDRTILAVKDISSKKDVLKSPIDHRWAWDDSGSGADNDVKVYELLPPLGYKCLGNVAMGSYRSGPNLKNYACVKTEYLEEVQISGMIWNDGGSGADDDIYTYGIADRKPCCVETGNFVTHRYSIWYSIPKKICKTEDGRNYEDVSDY